MEGHCRLGVKCAYKHKMRKNSDYENAHADIKNIKGELNVLKQTISHPREYESKIKILEDEVKVLKLQIKNLVSMNNKFSEIIQDIPSVKLPEVVKSCSNIPANLKIKCDMCDSSFKKKIT